MSRRSCGPNSIAATEIASRNGIAATNARSLELTGTNAPSSAPSTAGEMSRSKEPLSVVIGGISQARIKVSRWGEGFTEFWINRWLVSQSAFIGVFGGFVPAVGACASTWVAYGHSIRSSRDKSRYGRGEIRGVAAAEGANNVTVIADLVPTLLFSVPGGPAAAIFLGALFSFGYYPGPRMITQNPDLMFLIVWSVALASIVGALICFTVTPSFWCCCCSTCYAATHRPAPFTHLANPCPPLSESIHDRQRNPRTQHRPKDAQDRRTPCIGNQCRRHALQGAGARLPRVLNQRAGIARRQQYSTHPTRDRARRAGRLRRRDHQRRGQGNELRLHRRGTRL